MVRRVWSRSPRSGVKVQRSRGKEGITCVQVFFCTVTECLQTHMATGFQGRSMAAWPVDCWAAGAGGHCARDCSDEAGAVRASSLFGGGEGRCVLCFCSVLARGVRPALPLLPVPNGAARAQASVRLLFSVDDETRASKRSD